MRKTQLNAHLLLTLTLINLFKQVISHAMDTLDLWFCVLQLGDFFAPQFCTSHKLEVNLRIFYPNKKPIL